MNELMEKGSIYELSDPNEQGSNKIKNREIADFGLEIITENFENENILISPISMSALLGEPKKLF